MAEQNSTSNVEKEEQSSIAPTVTVTQPPANPLAGYYRQPKIYIKLPSDGNFYPDGALDTSENGDYPVMAMTAKDELMMKTPDALLSGESTVAVIKSCIPAIVQPWLMPTTDVDAVLMAIRIATYGDEMDMLSTCPKCSEENKYTVELTKYLNQAQSNVWNPVFNIGELKMTIQPYTYKQMTKTNIKALEQQRVFNIVNDDAMSDEEKIERFQKSFKKLTELTVDTIADVISKIETPNGDSTDKAQIQEFINNADKEIFQGLLDTVTAMKDKSSIPDQNVKCESCKHEWAMPITMDQANFFADRS